MTCTMYKIVPCNVDIYIYTYAIYNDDDNNTIYIYAFLVYKSFKTTYQSIYPTTFSHLFVDHFPGEITGLKPSVFHECLAYGKPRDHVVENV